MRFLAQFHPKHFFRALDDIDRQAKGLSTAGADYRTAVVLLTAAVCLLLLHYMKFKTSFIGFLNELDPRFGYATGGMLQDLQKSPFFALLGYAWWGIWHVIAYALIPLLVIKIGLREPMRDFGLRLHGLGGHLRWYVLLCAPILCFVVLASFRKDFADHYPFYTFAHRSWVDLLAWESIYIMQFICLEFFFRGFLLQGCKRAFGANAIFVMCLPYLMIHFAKPWLEATGAILFGIFLGVLALRSGSIWGGVMVHVAVAVSMDLAALIQGRGLPDTFWP